MQSTTTLNSYPTTRTFEKNAVRNGKAIRLNCIEINGQTFSITGKIVKVVKLEHESYENINDPALVVTALKNSECKPDIFTFCQRVPDTEPKHKYSMEWESLAVLPIKNFDYWWNKQVKGTTRNMIRKSQKAGVEVREAAFDDEFVRGMVDIFNESPVRQGFRFWHYGKDFDSVKREFSRFLFREDVIGAYYQGELIGFGMLANAGQFGNVGMFLAKMKHRDKAVNNAIMSKMVEICARRQLPYLVYTTWRDTSLVSFKRHCGFEEMRVPRYFVPLTQKGDLALKLGFKRFRHGLKEGLPTTVKKPLKKLRAQWYNLRSGADRTAK